MKLLPIAAALVSFPLAASAALAAPLQAVQAPGDSKVSDEVRERISDRVNEYLWSLYEEQGFPGMAATLVLPDGSALDFPVGYADVEAEVEMAPEHRLLSGSIGKTYVTAAAHHLMLAGKLSFDDLAAEYFDDQEWWPRVPNAGSMTIRQLLRHEAGLPRYVFKPEFFAACLSEPDRAWEPKEILAWVFDDEPVFPAGEGWAYSDTHFIVVGMIIEKVSGKKFYDYVTEHFLEPLKLKDTVASDSRTIAGLTQGYCVSMRNLGMPEKMLVDGVFCYNPQFEWCGGGYASTSRDLARWAWLLYRGEAMEGDYLSSMLDSVPARLGPGIEYGYGVMKRETPLGTQIGHDGVMSGYHASTGYFDKTEIAAAVLINTDDSRILGAPIDRVVERLASIAHEELDR